jgi:hypothetical protein
MGFAAGRPARIKTRRSREAAPRRARARLGVLPLIHVRTASFNCDCCST